MSQYLVTRIHDAPNVEVRLLTEIVGTRGDGHLEGITLCDRSAGSVDDVATSSVYIFIGMIRVPGWEVKAGCYAAPETYAAVREVMARSVASLRVN